jgi:PIN domain nuclease of toxin-antitoxin system
VSEAVLDASALLALLNREPGHEEVARTIPDAAISAVNLSEVAAKLAESGMPEESIREALGGLAIDVHDFGRDLAFQTAMLRPLTKHKGLSLADRACLALGQRLDLPVITADRVWKELDLEVEVRLIRSRQEPK